MVEQDDCEEIFNDNDYNDITDNMVCAGGRGSDFCTGDQGGPLVCPNADGDLVKKKILFSFTSFFIAKKNNKLEQVLAGIASFADCGFDRYPGVYTKMANYAKWIEDTIGGSTDEEEFY